MYCYCDIYFYYCMGEYDSSCMICSFFLFIFLGKNRNMKCYDLCRCYYLNMVYYSNNYGFYNVNFFNFGDIYIYDDFLYFYIYCYLNRGMNCNS